ncbi:MAG: hypothetical protein EAZ57_03100 [Cytophagales bacterium]|nr:MAG: hypothetical protein EAZ67_03565 [Cytophagales bacterium]TAF61745.1 MAG: hypothetical protein EAZ57_03100 [Cytophagales bacterium]
MKQFLLTLAAYLGLLLCSQLQAQNMPKATMTAEQYLMLDHQQPLSSVYRIELADLDFKTSEQAQRFFDKFNEKDVSFELHFSEGFTLVKLDLNAATKKGWTREQWGMLFKMRIQKQRETSGQFLDLR